MKKTLHTLLTAAAFTAAMGGIYAANANAADNSQHNSCGIDLDEDETAVFLKNTTPLEKIITTTTETIVTTTTQPVAQPDYGPPYMYMPRGDMTLDFQLDALDLAKMRNMLISGEHDEWDDKLADTNNDGEFNIADVVTMQNYLLGRIDEFELPQPVYGAPLIYETK